MGALNFSVFWALLFVAAYRLPGGVAATLGAIQPLAVILLARTLLGTPVRGLSVLAATPTNVAGIAYLGLIGAALTYVLWFRGVARLEPAVVSSLGFLSPITAVLLGWGLLGQHLSAAQIAGMAVVAASV